ncbi:MAG: DUF503 domain-containing protein [Tissierellia bacterium]|nr:DUF503 domain-containing protein [Tissierellia bacterium]
MIVVACEIRLMIYGSSSLKDKRKIVKSIIGRIKSRFNVSIAEVELNDSWNMATIGVACVTNDSNHGNDIIQNVIKFIDGDSRVEITNYNIQIM